VCVGPSNALVILGFNQEECERAFEILFKILREDTLSITADCSVQSGKFQSLISKLQRGALVQIDVLPEENSVRIIGVDEDISGATKEIYVFIKTDRIHSDTHRPQVSKHIWNFLRDCENVKKIAKEFEQYSISIEITESDDYEQFLVCGFNEGIEQCKQRLTEFAATIVEQEKKLEYPGFKRLFLDQSGKEQLQMIEKEMDVDIEIIVQSGRRFSKAPVPLPRTFSLPNKKPESFIYDECNFTTKEGTDVSWKYGNIGNEAVSSLKTR
jgi:hypothetical protein